MPEQEINLWEEMEPAIDAIDTENQVGLRLNSIEHRYDDQIEQLKLLEEFLIKLRSFVCEQKSLDFGQEQKAINLRCEVRDIINEYFTYSKKKGILGAFYKLLSEVDEDNYFLWNNTYEKVWGYIDRLNQAKLGTINKISKTLGITTQGNFCRGGNNQRYKGIPFCTTIGSGSSKNRALSDGNASI